MSKSNPSSILGLSLLLLLSAAPSQGAIQSTVPAVTQVPPPPSVVPGQLPNSSHIIAFNEQQCVTLEETLSVNATEDGTVPQPLISIPIAAGTVVSCHFLNFDPVTVGALGGKITFDADILGVIVSDPDLDSSDSVCGLPGTAYPTGALKRGIEQPNDLVGIDHANRRVHVDWRAGNPGDQIRVITRCTPTGIPEIEAKLDQLEPQLLDNQTAAEAKLDALQSQIEAIRETLDSLKMDFEKIENKLDRR